MSESSPEIRPEKSYEERTKEVLAGLKEQMASANWKGTALERQGYIQNDVLEIIEENCPLLLKNLEVYKNERGENLFAGKEKALNEVSRDLFFAYIFACGKNLKNERLFAGEMPEAQESQYWQLIQAFTSFYPNKNNPFVELINRAAMTKTEPFLAGFEDYLKNGEDKANYLSQPIEPQKLGISIEGFPDVISPRNAIATLLHLKEQENKSVSFQQTKEDPTA